MVGASSLRIGIDTGGTFTDGVLVEGRRRASVKVPSTPDDPARAVLAAVEALLGRRRGLPRDVRVHHGSTVATNTVLTSRGARVVFVTTTGFEDVLHLARGTRSDLHALWPSRPAPLVPRDRLVGVPERTGADGRAVLALTDPALSEVARRVVALGPEAVAVSLLHAVRAPRHERRVVRRLVAALAGSGVSVHAGTDVSADPREAERGATAVLDAYVAPAIRSYVARLSRALPRGALTIMRSDGGRMGAREACRHPVRTLLSGPAGGVAAAARVAARLGLQRALSFDVGGTSTDACWIEGEDLPVGGTVRVGDHEASVPGLPLETVGAGGGSEVWIDPGGALRVGPGSAGADPGPACYGRGGPFTLTDAWLVLGRLPPALLGGAFPLDAAAAHRAADALARRAGVPVRTLARGAVEVAATTTARLLSRASVARGKDPRGAHLVAFGGAGPTLAAETAERLDLRGVVVPPEPGALAAWGALVAPLCADQSAVVLGKDVGRFAGLARPLARAVRAALAKQGARRPTVRAEIDARYAGQAFEVTVPLGARWRAAFDAAHAARYGFEDPARPVEVVRLRVRGTGHEDGPVRPAARRAVHAASRPIVPRAGHPVPRADLAPGARVVGPAVIVETTATTWVPRGWRATVGAAGDLVLERSR